ncbi:TetR/AcrR family transcriptional regulator [Amycolatopsis cynarae]|uniref:TetR/AcrR family transcriptional regulator n=1 Tax=Amycolatopsis cynarae TaxID=2995223 RepID=A0ABY7B8M5_9PSEU|nr:TetR/AcrR family transcriptional regulator [Amycolatopsis sp. HUAS 11-8]WAL68695.1 TetR/AcrR family transcriptional regulator [Amycolatopsis sp. HUAS 11-8]
MTIETEVARAAEAGQEILRAQDSWTDLPPTARSIVRSALDSFADRGFNATTLKHIAAGTGLSTAALYVHFGSKDELFFEISRRGHESAFAIVEAASMLSPAQHAFRTLVYTFARWHAEQRTTARVVQYELHALSGKHAETVAGIRRATEQVVRDVITRASGPGAPEDPELRGVSAAILSLGIDVARWFVPGAPYTPDEIGRLYCRLATRLLRPDVF